MSRTAKYIILKDHQAMINWMKSTGGDTWNIGISREFPCLALTVGYLSIPALDKRLKEGVDMETLAGVEAQRDTVIAKLKEQSIEWAAERKRVQVQLAASEATSVHLAGQVEALNIEMENRDAFAKASIDRIIAHEAPSLNSAALERYSSAIMRQLCVAAAEIMANPIVVYTNDEDGS